MGLMGSYITNITEAIGGTPLLRLDRLAEALELEGIFSGFSSGANVSAAVKLLRGAEKGRKIGVVINDCGLKYMSTDLF